MSEKENAFPSVAADREGLNVKDAFNIHEALEDVKGESPACKLLYKNPYLTAGSRGIFPLLENKKDPLLEFDPLAFRLNNFENLSLDKVTLILPASSFGDTPIKKEYWRYFQLMIDSGLRRKTENEFYSYSVIWYDDYCIQWGPKNGVSGNVRIEFNPNKADLSKLSAFFSAFDEKAFSLIRINRLDIAIDYGIYINPLCWRCSAIRKTSKNEDNAKVKTYYFGAKSSDLQIRIYDKAFELLEKEKINLGFNFWRVECELKSGIKCKDFFLNNKELLFEFNPFERLEFYDPFPIDTTGQGMYFMFLDLCRAYGMPYAISKLDKKTKKSYLERLSNDMIRIAFNPPSAIYLNCIRSVFNAFSSKLRELFLYGRENGLELPEN